MKSLCYLILAHSHLEYLAELIDVLSSDNIGFVVHIDSKCQEPIDNLLNKCGGKNVKILEHRENIVWGDKSMVDVVNYMSRVALSDERWDYFILLSGQDMPVKSPEYIKSYISQGGFKNYILASPLLSEECVWQEHGRRRIECYSVRLDERNIATIEPRKLNIGNLRQIGKTFLHGNAISLKNMLKVFISKKRRGFTLPVYGGEFWWRLNRESLSKIIKYYDSHVEFEQEVEYTSNPDEIVYNTLVNNLCDDIEKSILTYINWRGSKSPNWITLEDKDLVNKLICDWDILFCRKVRDIKLVEYVRKFF